MRINIILLIVQSSRNSVSNQKERPSINVSLGLALLLLPFFLIAHLLSYFLSYPMDGYSLLYQYAISIAALFYLWLGCKYLMRLVTKSGATSQNCCFDNMHYRSGN